MAMAKADFEMVDLMAMTTMTVTVRQSKVYKARYFLALLLFRIASKLLGCDLQIENENV